MKLLKLLSLFLIIFSFSNCSKEDDEIFVNETEVLEKSNLYSNIKWTGTWNSTYGELRLVEKGQLIYGDYSDIGVIYGYRHYINGKEYFEGDCVDSYCDHCSRDLELALNWNHR